MNRLTDTKSSLQESLNLLATKPNMRPFLFRTRFERTMVRLLAYTDETPQPQLPALAEHSLNTIRAIVLLDILQKNFVFYLTIAFCRIILLPKIPTGGI